MHMQFPLTKISLLWTFCPFMALTNDVLKGDFSDIWTKKRDCKVIS